MSEYQRACEPAGMSPGVWSLAALAAGLVLLAISLTTGEVSHTASATQLEPKSTGTSTGGHDVRPSDTPQQECEPVWHNVRVPETYADIVVDALSPTDAWAMASTQFLHWDGYTWTPFPYPVEGEVWMPVEVLMEASDSVWAIGNASIYEPVAFYWNGTAWTSLDIPARQDARPSASSHTVSYISLIGPGEAWIMSEFGSAGAGFSQTLDACRGARCTRQHLWWWTVKSESAPFRFIGMDGADGDVWGVGGVYQEDSPAHSYTEHWNGAEWEVVSTPNIGELLDVSRIGPEDAWAASETGVIHWDGSKWEIVPSPGGAKVLEVISDTNIWAADNARIMHWDGSEWKVVPSSGGAYEFSVVSADDIWARRNGAIMHWDGSTWQDVPHPRADRVQDMVATAPNDVWTVGGLASEERWQVDIWHYTNQQFQDMPQGQPFYSYVQGLACRSIISGYDCGGGGGGEPCEPGNLAYFRPGEQIKRGQLAKIVSNSAGYSDTPSTETFEDVAMGSPFYAYVERLVARGAMSGYACGRPREPCGEDKKPYFRPNDAASRGQISKIVSTASGFNEHAGEQIFADVSPGNAFYEWVQRLAARGVVSGYACGSPTEKCDEQERPYFRPNGNATRGQVTKIVSNTFFPKEAYSR